METKISIKPELMKDKDKEKKAGFGAALLGKLGLGSLAGGGASGLAAGGGSAATGFGLLASKTGIVALIVAGSAVAAAVSMLRAPSASGPAAGGSIFGKPASGPGADTMAGAAGAGGTDVSADGASASLDYFHKANQGAVHDARSAGGEGAAADGETVEAADAAADASEADSGVEAPDNSYGGGAGKTAAAARPQMVKSDKSFKGKSSRSSEVQLVAQAGLSQGIGGGFDKTYKSSVKTASTKTRATQGARTRSAVHRGKSALGQAKDVRRSHRNAMASRNLTSASAGRTYDGGAGRSGAIGAPADSASGAGTGTGGAGLSDSRFRPNRALDTRELPEPKKVKDAENKTPYQQSLDHAMYAILAAGVLLMAAGLMKNAAKTNPAWSTGVKIAAGLAAAAAGIAIIKGLELMNTYGQNMQGMMFMGMGGIILFQSGRMLIDEFAEKKAEEGVQDISKMTQKQVEERLGTLNKIPSDKMTVGNKDEIAKLSEALNKFKK